MLEISIACCAFHGYYAGGGNVDGDVDDVCERLGETNCPEDCGAGKGEAGFSGIISVFGATAGVNVCKSVESSGFSCGKSTEKAALSM